MEADHTGPCLPSQGVWSWILQAVETQEQTVSRELCFFLNLRKKSVGVWEQVSEFSLGSLHQCAGRGLPGVSSLFQAAGTEPWRKGLED